LEKVWDYSGRMGRDKKAKKKIDEASNKGKGEKLPSPIVNGGGDSC